MQRELALPTVQCEGRAFSSSSLGSFYIGQLCCYAPAMEKPQLVQKLSGKEFVDHLAISELDSTKLLQQQLSSGGANTALHNELSDKPAYSKRACRQLTQRISLSLIDQLCPMSFQHTQLTAGSACRQLTQRESLTKELRRGALVK